MLLCGAMDREVAVRRLEAWREDVRGGERCKGD